MAILFCLPFYIVGQDVNNNFTEANSAYRAGDYTKAIALYSGIITQGYTSSELNYNIGTAYLQLDSIAHANLYLERALKAAPFDSRIQANLALARDKVATDIYEVPEFILKRAWDTWTNVMSPNGWLFLQLLVLGIILIVVYMWQFRSGAISRKRLRIGLIVLVFLLAILLVSGSYASHQKNTQDTAIIMYDQNLLSGPDERAELIQQISPGVKVKVIDEIDDWLRVELLNREAGWVEKSAISRI